MYPILFKLGPLTIHTYGVVVSVAFLIGFWLIYNEARRTKFFPDKILDLELIILISGIIGARALHVATHFDYYKSELITVFFLWRGGLAIYGGIIGGIFASWIFIRRKDLPLYRTADLIIPYVALSQSIGRIGCFLNGCCFGRTSIAYLGFVFPSDTVPRYPTQLYASFLLIIIFVILKISYEKPHREGNIFTLYIMLYSLQRFFVDFLRGDNPRFLANLTVSQIISVVLFFAALFLFSFFRRNKLPQ